MKIILKNKHMKWIEIGIFLTVGVDKQIYLKYFQRIINCLELFSLNYLKLS